MSKFQRHFSPDEDAAILDGLNDGLPWEDIAATLDNRTPHTARMRAQRMGLRTARTRNDDYVTCPIKPTRDLLHALEAQFHQFSRIRRVDYLDARTLLMDGRLAL